MGIRETGNPDGSTTTTVDGKDPKAVAEFRRSFGGAFAASAAEDMAQKRDAAGRKDGAYADHIPVEHPERGIYSIPEAEARRKAASGELSIRTRPSVLMPEDWLGFAADGRTVWESKGTGMAPAITTQGLQGWAEPAGGTGP